MIEISKITKSFGELIAISDLSFSTSTGEIFGIVGPDGAGKSTLLRIIAGLMLPDKGCVRINGHEIHKNNRMIKRHMAYMPQRFGLYEDLSVEENIFFFGRLYGVSRRDIFRRMDDLYDFSRLGPFGKRMAGMLSGGMKQKLGLACCLVHKPSLIMLDEPTNGVDPVSRREFWKILYDLLGQGVTVLVSTAYLDEAERCNRLALMHNGRFLVTGSPGSIKASMKRSLIEIETDKVWDAELVLRTKKTYSTVIREGKNLRLFVSDIKKDSDAIRNLLEKERIGVGKIQEKTATLENCFMEIVSGGESL